MRISTFAKRDLYYTRDHEWIDFQGSIAYIGVCAFKLKGIRQVHKLDLAGSQGVIPCGQVIASICYDDYDIPVHMTVEGEILSFNELLSPENWHLLLEEPETRGWIALVVPSRSNETGDLMNPEQYSFFKIGRR
jgi:glycine cleavage system H protein